MRQMQPMKVHYTQEPVAEPLRVNGPVRQIDVKEKRRQHIAVLSRVINAVHKTAFARLAK